MQTNHYDFLLAADTRRQIADKIIYPGDLPG